MSAQSHSSPVVGLNADAQAGALRREAAGWAWLAVGALAVAGIFALLLALSRVPGMDKAPFWPIGFFYKGLVIHVVFSLVIWFMGVFAFLVTVATERAISPSPLAGEGRGEGSARAKPLIRRFAPPSPARGEGVDVRAAPLGRIGQGIALVAFPCLFAPAFFDADPARN